MQNNNNSNKSDDGKEDLAELTKSLKIQGNDSITRLRSYFWICFCFADLNGMLEICGVAPEKFRIICLSIDKLDKQAFEQVKKEMVEERVLSSETADRIGNFVKEKGAHLELFTKLEKCNICILTQNMRVQQDEKEFAKWILKVGNGEAKSVPNEKEDCLQIFRNPQLRKLQKSRKLGLD